MIERTNTQIHATFFDFYNVHNYIDMVFIRFCLSLSIFKQLHMSYKTVCYNSYHLLLSQKVYKVYL